MGMMILDAADTVMVMGMDDDYRDCVAWIRQHLDFARVGKVSFFETTIRALGGLLGACVRLFVCLSWWWCQWQWQWHWHWRREASELVVRLLLVDGNYVDWWFVRSCVRPFVRWLVGRSVTSSSSSSVCDVT